MVVQTSTVVGAAIGAMFAAVWYVVWRRATVTTFPRNRGMRGVLSKTVFFAVEGAVVGGVAGSVIGTSHQRLAFLCGAIGLIVGLLMSAMFSAADGLGDGLGSRDTWHLFFKWAGRLVLPWVFVGMILPLIVPLFTT